MYAPFLWRRAAVHNICLARAPCARRFATPGGRGVRPHTIMITKEIALCECGRGR